LGWQVLFLSGSPLFLPEYPAEKVSLVNVLLARPICDPARLRTGVLMIFQHLNAIYNTCSTLVEYWYGFSYVA
jgi:hypothetical protein